MLGHILKKQDRLIFHYYKWYRCNIRLKVAVIQAMQLIDETAFEEKLTEIKRYWQLFQSYVKGLKLELSPILSPST